MTPTKVKNYILQNGLLQGSGPVIVGLSGGIDSVALLHLLKDSGYPLVAAHCNFHLRGDESNRDEAFVRELCGQLKVPLEVHHVDIDAWRREHGGSVEMAARESRYEWFEELYNKYGARAIAVAHHLDDNVETMLLNLLRGTGIAGLRGMRPRNGHVERPLLQCRREELSAYLRERGVEHVEDSTNAGTDYTRNRIRNEVLPAIRRWWPSAEASMSLTIDNMAQAEAYIEQSLAADRRAYTDSRGGIEVRRLVKECPSAQFMLYSWLRDEGLSAQQSLDMLMAADNSGARFEIAGKEWVIDHGVLRRVVSSIESEDFPFEVEYLTRDEFVPVRDTRVAYFDASVMEGEPLKVRTWCKGDRLKPFGMRGSKLVSDIFSDAHIGVDRKNAIPLLTKGDEILWVCGVRCSREYKVEVSTESIVKLTYLGSI